MANDDLPFGGLSAIEVDSEDEALARARAERLPRDFQSDADFHKVKEGYAAKSEAGELWKALRLPADNPTKAESQAILHAIEELYFYRRYEEARDVTRRALQGKLMEEYRCVLEVYGRRCERRMGASEVRRERDREGEGNEK